MIDELDLPNLQDFSTEPGQPSEPTNKDSQTDHAESNNEPDSKSQTSQDNMHQDEPINESDSNYQVKQVDIEQDQPTSEPDSNSEASKDNGHQDESNSSSQSSPLPVITHNPESKPIDDKQKPAKQNEAKSKKQSETVSSNQSKKKSKKSKQTSPNQALKKSKQPEKISSNKTEKKSKKQLKRERKLLAERKAKEEEKNKALTKKKKEETSSQKKNGNQITQVAVTTLKSTKNTNQEETTPIKTRSHKSNNNQIPQVMAAKPRTIKKKDKSKSVTEEKSIEKTYSQSEPEKTKKSKDKALDKPTVVKEAAFIKVEQMAESISKPDPKLADPNSSEVSLNNVKNESLTNDSPLQERSPRYPRRAVGAQSMEKLRMMAAADATVAKSISRERGRNKKRTQSVLSDTRPTKKHMSST
jgi:hypothetical protein